MNDQETLLMSPQEQLDYVVSAIINQGGPSMEFTNEDGEPPINACMYRAASGRRCAVGWLIPDALYKPEYEGQGIYTLLHNFPELQELDQVGDMLHDLQELHDLAAADATSDQKFLAEFVSVVANWAKYNDMIVPKIISTYLYNRFGE